MADRASLGLLGYICGGVTAAVMLMAFSVVLSHADGQMWIENGTAKTVIAMR